MSILTKYAVTALSLAVIFSMAGCQKSEPSASSPASQSISQSTTHETMNHNDMKNMQGMNHDTMTQQMLFASSPATASSESVYLTNGKWKDQSDRPFDIHALAGQKQVVAFIYTSCQDVCPIMMKTMRDLQDKLPTDIKSKTGFLVISLDPKRDTPQVLAKFGEHYNADDKWHFLNGSDEDIRLLANTLNIRYQFADNGMINHSNVISVLDESGKMIAKVVGNSDGEAQIIVALTSPTTTATTTNAIKTSALSTPTIK